MFLETNCCGGIHPPYIVMFSNASVQSTHILLKDVPQHAEVWVCLLGLGMSFKSVMFSGTSVSGYLQCDAGLGEWDALTHRSESGVLEFLECT
jgi:hypothetical protein